MDLQTIVMHVKHLFSHKRRDENITFICFPCICLEILVYFEQFLYEICSTCIQTTSMRNLYYELLFIYKIINNKMNRTEILFMIDCTVPTKQVRHPFLKLLLPVLIMIIWALINIKETLFVIALIFSRTL